MNIFNIFFPAKCYSCGQFVRKIGFCPPCKARLTPRPPHRCTQCDRLFRAASAPHRCGDCLRRNAPFDSVHGVFEYEGPAGLAIRNGKYQCWPEALDALGRSVAMHLPASLISEPPSIVIPMPLHSKRRVKRGFSPPAILARHIGRALGRPLLRNGLVRNVHTRDQAGLTARERQANVAGAFRIGVLKDADDVLLVDDVFTTGSTLRAASRVLRRHGAQRIRGLCAAYVDEPPPEVGRRS
ncbi:MAG: double zinc ribbon domain-containing protein [Myxococcota bacterium]|nr:double zinc ribbon domain-containing protein [Myxococcota bacterium]